MTAGKTQRNNRVLLQHRPITLLSQGNYLHECTYTQLYMRKMYIKKHSDNPQTPKHIHMYKSENENEKCIYWFLNEEVLQ